VALCALTRAELLLLAVLLVVPLAFGTKIKPWRTRLAWLGVAALVCVGALAPWVGYNLHRFDGRVLLSSQAEWTLAGSNCDTSYYGQHIGYWSFACGMAAIQQDGVEMPENHDGARQRAWLDSAERYVKAHPQRLVVVEGVRMARIFNVWSPQNSIDIESYVEANSTWVARLSLVSLWPMVVGAVAGAVVLRRRRIPVFPLLAPCATVIFTVLLFYASSRFRASAEGALCLLTAVALEAGWVWHRHRRSAREPVSA
jgi:hypothetical protein